MFLQKFDAVFSGDAASDADREDLETLAAALKPLSTWHALDTLQEAREACGGAGFLFENRLVGLRADLDIYATFEGDNNVLLQLVGKRLLSDYAKQFKGADAKKLVAYAAGQTAGHVFHGSGLRQLGQAVSDFGSTARSVERGLRAEQQHELLTERVQQMVADIAARLRPAAKLSEGRGGGDLQRQPVRAHRGGPRARRAAAVGGVHGCRRRDRGCRHQAGAHLAA